jgi:hypothetical protein
MLEARVRIELTHKGFADLSLTTWVPRPKTMMSDMWPAKPPGRIVFARHLSLVTAYGIFGAGDGGRTRDFDLGKVALYH